MAKRMHLFEGYGIELEYMIVNRETLDVMPIADKLLEALAGEITEDFENGAITISNELVLHVIELKCTTPDTDLIRLEKDFEQNIKMLNSILKEKFNAKLMPTAAHPWMNPKKETFLWPHGNSEVYEKYNEIFDCSGHGWSNLQSIHINLPFSGDKEFARLHTAARTILPLLPSLSASSPILDEAFSGVHDKRMVYYQNNQKRIPSITGNTIPEAVFSKAQYQNEIYDKIREQVKEYDPEQILNPVWLNSRGIIARFDRGSIEIRVLDIQECPKFDLAIASFVILVVKLLVEEKIARFEDQKKLDTLNLQAMLQSVIIDSGKGKIIDIDYLKIFGLEEKEYSIHDFWTYLLKECVRYYPDEINHWQESIQFILNKGTLASRILEVANTIYTHTNLKLIYQELSQNLEENKPFEPCDQFIL